MSVTYNLLRQLTPPSGSPLGTTALAITSGQAVVISEAIPSNQTDLAVACAFVVAKLKAVYILSNVAMTITTNDTSGGSPQETITLVAGVPYSWALGGSRIGADDAPFAGNVTGLYVTNTTAGQLEMVAVVDPT